MFHLHVFMCFIIVRFLSTAKQEAYFYNNFLMKVGRYIFRAHLQRIKLYACHTTDLYFR